MSVAAMNMFGPFTGIFAYKLGASNYQIALMSSAPALVSLLAMIPGARYIDRQPRKKRITAAVLLTHRFFYFLIALIPFFAKDYRASMLVAAVALMNLPGAVGNVAWQSFISRVIPPEQRANAFAARNRMMNIIGTAVTLVAGRALDIMSFPVGYQLLFTVAFLTAMVEIWVFNHVDEGESVAPTPAPGGAGLVEGFRGAIKEIGQQKRFVRYTLVSIFFYFAWQTPWPLFTLYQVGELGANNTWVSILSLINTGGSLIGYGFWAKYSEKHGNLETLFASSIWIFLVPLAYAFSKSLYTIAAFNLVTGMVFSGVNLALFNALLEVTPEERKTSYIAYYNTAVNTAAVFAPMMGVALRNAFGFQIAFILCAALRFLGSAAFRIVKRMDAPQAEAS
jgi:MFS family permease